jgi:(2Fe-2S) ferredoxin
MNEVTKRVVLCRGQYCNMDRRADKLYALLDPMIQEMNGDAYPPRIRLTTANCLSMCGAGPNCIVYPEGQVFNGLNAEKLVQMVEQYLTPQE